MGRRYVVGEGFYVDGEEGAPIPLPALMTMTPGVPTAEELAAEEAADDPGVVIELPPKLHPELAAEANSVEPADLVEIVLDLHNDEPGLRVELDRGLATGKILTEEDWHAESAILIAEREERITAKTQGVIEEIEDSGGHVLFRGEQSAWVHALVPAYALQALVSRPDVASAEPNSAGTPLSHGVVHQHGAQIRQFVQNGWTGGSGSGNGVVAAIVEVENVPNGPNSFHPNHAAWTDGTVYRFGQTGGGKWNCYSQNGNPTCSNVNTFPNPAHEHATTIAGIIFGDLTKGQIPSLPPSDRDLSSGYARDARAYFFHVQNGSTVVKFTYDSIRLFQAFNADPPHVVNSSFRFGSNPACSGMTTLAKSANDVFKDGIAMIAAAGNDGGSTSQCTVGAPGDAIGVFTVGGHMPLATSDAIDVRTAAIWSGSAWGGNAAEGQNRAIIDMTAPARRRCLPNTQGGVNCDSAGFGPGTSYAAPVVTATAMDIMDYHMSGGSNWITAPSALYSMLLVMGDRQSQRGKSDHGADHLWGVGRLRARWMSSSGLDSPYYWYHGYTCISHLETWDFQFNSNNIPNDVEAVKAAAYWYDYRHDTAGTVANVNMYLHSGGSPLASDADANDNKAFLFVEDWPNAPLYLRLRGLNVSGHHDPACSGAAPNNKIKVYFTIFAEDSDRNSPTYNPNDGTGIYPESL